MSLRRLLSPAVFACSAFLITLPASTQASAQDLIDFLWGGTSEWGGGRQTVRFSEKYSPGQIIVSFGDRRLYHVTGPGVATSYPIAIPREQSRWQGVTSVSMKRVNPAWVPTAEMRRENPRLPSYVPGGHSMNPLGVRALYLGSSTYRIHGTDAPYTIGQAVSKGCIRMYNEDVLHLYPRVAVGARVTVTWQRFNANAVANYSDSPAVDTDRPRRKAPQRRIIRNLPPEQPEKAATTQPAAEKAVDKPAAEQPATKPEAKPAEKMPEKSA